MNSQNREMSSRTASVTQQLATLYLGRDVLTFIAERRANNTAWRVIARDLYDATDHRIDITHETIRLWMADHEDAA